MTRTIPFIFSGKGTAAGCPVCGKTMNVKTAKWQVFVSTNEGVAIHPDDVSNRPPHPEEGWWQIGAECRKKFGDFAKPA